MSADPYFFFVSAAYGASAVALGALGLWTFIDARASQRALRRLEARRPRRGASA